jgi:hypothetical protein
VDRFEDTKSSVCPPAALPTSPLNADAHTIVREKLRNNQELRALKTNILIDGGGANFHGFSAKVGPEKTGSDINLGLVQQKGDDANVGGPTEFPT